MVKISLNTTEDESTLVVNVKGHTDYAEEGKDIVCAAVSILTITIAQLIRDFYAEGKLRKKPQIDLLEGDTTLACKPLNKYREEVSCAFSVAITGYKLLALNYPEYVALELFDVPFMASK